MDFLFQDFLATPVWFWLAFISLVIGLTAFDLGFLHKEDREMGISESMKLSIFYIAVAMAFGVWVYFHKVAAYGEAAGTDLAVKYFTGYFIEKALSIDNVFVISLIFAYFSIPAKYQYRALLWGIVAVIILRGVMIAAGAALVQQFHWLLYVFAAFLIGTGVKMLFSGQVEMDVQKNPVVRFMSKHMRVTKTLHNEKFFVKERDEKTGKMVRAATPLFLALVVINLADLVFAVDSVPAIFAITTDTFIVYTSNIMAILGLRALYFALAAMVNRFHYLRYALALVLIFIGSKIFVADFLMGGGKFPPIISLAVTFALILGGILFSLYKTKDAEKNMPPS